MRRRGGDGRRRGRAGCGLAALALLSACGSELSREQAADPVQATGGARPAGPEPARGAAKGPDPTGPGDRSDPAVLADRSGAPVPADRLVAPVPADRSAAPVPADSLAPAGAPVPEDRPIAGGAEFPGAPEPIACGVAPAGMACVPAGPFVRGSDDGPDNTRPAARVWLQTYYMDVNEVTYAEYKACVKARACDPSGPGYTDFDRPRQPINGIRWFDAVKYCEAQGKHLPTEAQWEKAARGPDGALHPWGDEPATCERAIIKDEKGRSCGVKKLYSKPDTGRPFEVGSRPAYRYGLHDMAGNSWEWVADWYTRSYAECGADCAGVDPLGPCAGADTCPGNKRKLVRGGSWYWDAAHATAIYRRPHYPENQPFHHFGFRCAASPAEAQALAAGPAADAAGPARPRG